MPMDRYTESVARFIFLALALAGALAAQDKQLQQRPPVDSAKSDSAKSDSPKTDSQADQEPPEEDSSVAPKTYSFNPLEAEKDIKIGAYYFKRGKYRAASGRFREATLWNPNSAEAFLRLGESEEKLNNRKTADEAYNKYLTLNPDGKEADTIKKKLAHSH